MCITGPSVVAFFGVTIIDSAYKVVFFENFDIVDIYVLHSCSPSLRITGVIFSKVIDTRFTGYGTVNGHFTEGSGRVITYVRAVTNVVFCGSGYEDEGCEYDLDKFVVFHDVYSLLL